MTRLYEVYQCQYCGNVVKVMHPGIGTLVCCGVEMNKLDRWFEEAIPPTNPEAPTVKVK